MNTITTPSHHVFYLRMELNMLLIFPSHSWNPRWLTAADRFFCFWENPKAASKINKAQSSPGADLLNCKCRKMRRRWAEVTPLKMSSSSLKASLSGYKELLWFEKFIAKANWLHFLTSPLPSLCYYFLCVWLFTGRNYSANLCTTANQYYSQQIIGGPYSFMKGLWDCLVRTSLSLWHIVYSH